MSSLTDGHATMLRSAVPSGRQVVHQSWRIFVGREVSSAAAAASQSSQSATCQLCERSSVAKKKVADFVQKPPGYTRFCQFPKINMSVCVDVRLISV